MEQEIIEINKGIPIDLQKLIDSKLLIQANSGGGKSWLIRRILEQSHGKVQQIVLDPEGEFGTLREKYDYILVGKDGDTPAESRSAALLAHKLLEIGVSAIIDLYELHPQERKHFVRLFLEAMVNAPKDLWHPVLVVIDEAHTFVPEKGDSEAANAVIGLASLGRKRGFGVVLATQRISKLHKDAAAECNNKLIGRTGLDIDRKRAGEELGFSGKDEFLSMRSLKPGEFYAFGPAISDEVIKVTVGTVQTSHPVAGGRMIGKITPPTNAIKEVLSKLADLPKEAEKEATTSKELSVQNAALKRKVFELEKKAKEPGIPANPVRIEKIEVPMIGKRTLANFQKAEKLFRKHATQATQMYQNMMGTAGGIMEAVDKLSEDVKKVSELWQDTEPKKKSEPMLVPFYAKKDPEPLPWNPQPKKYEDSQTATLGRCAAMIYSFLAKHQGRKFNRRQIGAATGYSLNSSGFQNAISQLNAMGLIVKSGDYLFVSSVNEVLARYINHDFSVKVWLNNLGKCAKEIYQILLDNPTSSYTKEEIAQATPSQYSVSSSGFQNAISALNSTGLIKREGNRIGFNPELLEI